MQKAIPEKILYYEDELNDDFAGTHIQAKPIDELFHYKHKNPIWRFFSFFFYYCIAFPLIWLYERVFLQVKFVNKKALKKLKGTPCFFYGNHTSFMDAFTPNLLSFPKSNTASYSLSLSVKRSQTLVAFPRQTGRTPSASGSSVPV